MRLSALRDEIERLEIEIVDRDVQMYGVYAPSVVVAFVWAFGVAIYQERGIIMNAVWGAICVAACIAWVIVTGMWGNKRRAEIYARRFPAPRSH